MSVLFFLLAPLVAIVVASFVLVLQQRKPQGMRSSIEGFQQQMKALSPEDDAERKG
jgi:preprotein translocase subunit SecG